MVVDMKKLNEYTRKYIDVTEIDTVFRSDGIAYSVYKDDTGKYYVDAYDGSYSIAEFGQFENDADAVKKAIDYIEELYTES